MSDTIEVMDCLDTPFPCNNEHELRFTDIELIVVPDVKDHS
jgi:hypothetical protein